MEVIFWCKIQLNAICPYSATVNLFSYCPYSVTGGQAFLCREHAPQSCACFAAWCQPSGVVLGKHGRLWAVSVYSFHILLCGTYRLFPCSCYCNFLRLKSNYMTKKLYARPTTISPQHCPLNFEAVWLWRLWFHWLLFYYGTPTGSFLIKWCFHPGHVEASTDLCCFSSKHGGELVVLRFLWQSLAKHLHRRSSHLLFVYLCSLR